MDKIKVTFEDGKTQVFPRGITIYDAIKRHNVKEHVLGAIVDDKVTNLGDKLLSDTKLGYVKREELNGYRMYIAGLKILLECATSRVFPEIKVTYPFDVPHGIAVEFFGKRRLSIEDIGRIDNEMKKIISENRIIRKKYLKRIEGAQTYDEINDIVKRDNIHNLSDPIVILYQLGKITNYYYYEMPYSTGVLGGYEIRYKGDNKAILQYATPFDNKEITSRSNIDKVVQNYEWGKAWLNLVKLPFVVDVNNVIKSGNIDDFVRTCELKFNMEIHEIAKTIYENSNIKFILLAGPSSSGKTTVTKRLSNYLKIYGKEPVVVSIDDYYKERVDTPKDEYGNYDFESPAATDTEYFLSDVQKLLNGEEIQLPVFNFITGCKELKGKKVKLSENSIILFEGINALHPTVLDKIDEDKKYYVYVSPFMPLRIDQHNFISGSDLRTLRRIIRDFRTRGYGVEASLESWLRVRIGEEKYILPYIHRANKIINTALPYEVGVLKVAVLPLLLAVPISSPQYGEARRLSSFLKQFFTINPEYVPKDSIIREFIGGGTND